MVESIHIHEIVIDFVFVRTHIVALGLHCRMAIWLTNSENEPILPKAFNQMKIISVSFALCPIQTTNGTGKDWKIKTRLKCFPSWNPLGMILAFSDKANVEKRVLKMDSSKCHSDTTYIMNSKLMLLTYQNVIIFALLHVRVRMFRIYRTFCESHPICEVMTHLVFFPRKLNIATEFD